MENIKLSEELQQSLAQMGVIELTNMQKAVLTHAIHGEDVFVLSPTGSGKTLAYLIPLLERITPQGKGKHYPAVLILAPTRELCRQIAAVIRSLLIHSEGIRTLVLTGGTGMNKQIRISSRGADIIVGTPSRILDHLRRHTFKKQNCHTLVLDEADDLLSMGFMDDVMRIIHELDLSQTMLFSATYPEEIISLKDSILKSPFIYREKAEVKAVSYRCYVAEEKDKPDLLKKLCLRKGQILVFTNQRNTADFLDDILKKSGLRCGAIHSDMDYKKRMRQMQKFREKQINILCATEVAARGIDISNLSQVICYDLPPSCEDLIHRFGRGGRLNHQAEVSLFLTNDQRKYLPLIKESFPDIKVIRYCRKVYAN